MDQLSDYFKRKFGDRYVTCDEGQSLLFIGDKNTYQVKLCLYTVKTDYCPGESDDNIIMTAVNNILPSIVNNPVYIFAKKLADNLHVKFIPVYFPGKAPVDNAGTPNAKFVITTSDGSKQGIKDESVFKNGLHNLLGIEPNNVPPKAENKSHADFFHEWSRNNLACGDSGITKCDLDGMFIDSKLNPSILIEIKRSRTISAKTWAPYENDYTGLHLLFNAASASGAQFWVIHHGTEREANDLDKNFQFSFFNITGFDTKGNPIYDSKKPVSMDYIEGKLNIILK